MHKLIEALTKALEKTLEQIIETEEINQPEETPKNIVEIAQETPDLSTLVSLLVKYELVDAVKNAENITVFAPTNEAFKKIESVLATLSKEQITDILLSHVVPKKFMLPIEKPCDKILETLGTLKHEIDGDTIKAPASNATVVIKNIEASNGIVQVIDNVLLPIIEDIDDKDDDELVELINKLLGSVLKTFNTDPNDNDLNWLLSKEHFGNKKKKGQCPFMRLVKK
jgi:uncharacterized surface protein with fasciclin (FAS1) repeats